jgi:hypothetical protein
MRAEVEARGALDAAQFTPAPGMEAPNGAIDALPVRHTPLDADLTVSTACIPPYGGMELVLRYGVRGLKKL